MVPRNNVDETDAKDLIDELTVLANMVCKRVSNAHQNIALHPFASFASKKVMKQILCFKCCVYILLVAASVHALKNRKIRIHNFSIFSLQR